MIQKLQQYRADRQRGRSPRPARGPGNTIMTPLTYWCLVHTTLERRQCITCLFTETSGMKFDLSHTLLPVFYNKALKLRKTKRCYVVGLSTPVLHLELPLFPQSEISFSITRLFSTENPVITFLLETHFLITVFGLFLVCVCVQEHKTRAGQRTIWGCRFSIDHAGHGDSMNSGPQAWCKPLYPTEPSQ